MKKLFLTWLAVSIGLTIAVSVSALPPGGNLGSPLNPSAWSIPLGGVWPFASGGYLGGDIKTKGGISVAALGTPAGCAVAKTGTGTGTTWGYRVASLSATGETLACSQVTVSGNATLDATHYNTVSWTALSGARGYYVYRTAAPGTPNTTGKLGTGACTPTVFTGTSAVDNGLCADTTSVASADTSGSLSFAGGVTSTGAFLGPNGAAATPTFGFSGDAGNGMYLSAADTLGFSTGGTEKMTLDNSGIASLAQVAATSHVIAHYPNLQLRYDSFWGANRYAFYSYTNTFNIDSAIANGAAAVAVRMGSDNAFTTEGANEVVVMNSTTEVAAIDKDGAIQITKVGGATPTCAAAHRNKLWVVVGGAGVTDTLYICLKAAADTYSWVSITTGG